MHFGGKNQFSGILKIKQMEITFADPWIIFFPELGYILPEVIEDENPITRSQTPDLTKFIFEQQQICIY